MVKLCRPAIDHVGETDSVIMQSNHISTSVIATHPGPQKRGVLLRYYKIRIRLGMGHWVPNCYLTLVEMVLSNVSASSPANETTPIT